MGLLTPLGLNVEDTWKAILAGKSSVARIDQFDAADLNCQICSRVKNFDYLQHFTEKEARKIDSFVQYGLVAAKEAIQDAGLQVTEENAPRIGLAVGSGVGGLPGIEKSHSV